MSRAPETLAEPRESDNGTWSGLTAQLAAHAAINPRLALDLLRTGWAFRRREWWRSAPFLPTPDREYLRWRMYTAYGSEEAVPPVEDVVRFARWRRETMGL
ncbi:MAG: hypothetical protein ACREL6_05770 [Gemmatimonadales bacterium]